MFALQWKNGHIIYTIRPILERGAIKCLNAKISTANYQLHLGDLLSSNGQDTHLIKMAEANSSNEIVFWCLQEYEEEYKRSFADTRIKVCSIQSLLMFEFGDEFLDEAAANIIYIGQETLGWGKDPDEFARGSRRDLVSFKNVFALLLLAMHGYVLDTNIFPEDETKAFELPAEKVFKLPKIPGQLECWMMYAPPQSQQARLALTYYLEGWQQLQDIYTKHGGYTEEFHNYPLMMSVLNFWNQTSRTLKVAFDKVTGHVMFLN